MKVSPPVRAWLPWLVLFSCLLFTIAGSLYVAETNTSRDQLRFGSATQELIGRLSARLDTYAALLHAASALFATTDDVSRAQFTQFVAHLDVRARFPGILGIGFSARFPPAERAGIEAAMRRQGERGFRVWPDDPIEGMYDAILYLEPLDARNVRAIGFNMYSNPIRRAAMRKAMLEGRAVTSGKVTLVQEIAGTEQQAGFLIYVPVYTGGQLPPTSAGRQRALQGFVYSPFRAGDLLQTLLSADERRDLVLRVFDGEAMTSGSLLFDSSNGTSDDLLPGLAGQFTVRTEGRPWTVFVGARPSFRSTSAALVPALFGLGLGLSVLLFLLTRAEARARAEAEAHAADLRRSEEALQGANQAKDEFLATLSHELRTPLNAILGWTRMLRVGHLDAERTAHALEVIERSARSLTRLVEDLLDVSRIITGKLRLDLRVVDLNPAVEQAIDIARPAADAKGVSMNFVPDPNAGAIVAAPERLQQILWNLLSNAIKFTPAGGRIELRSTRRMREVEVAVSDTGIGISPEFLPHVFERFRQADSTSTRSHAGVGLGLAIVRHLVELHGGSIAVGSGGVGKGATFSVRFPVRAASSIAPVEPAPLPAPPVAAVPEPFDLSQLRVLVVDDEADARELVRTALEREGATVSAAASVSEALALLDREGFDLIVSDLAMPERDGFDLVRHIRGMGPIGWSALPMIALTAYARPRDRDRVLAAGFQGYVSKPFEIGDLVALIGQVTARGPARSARH